MLAKRGLAIALLGLAMSVSSWAAESNRLRVDLVLVDPAELVPSHLMARGERSLTREVSHLFDGIGIEVDWVPDAGESPIENGRFELRVVLVPTPPERWGLAKDVMGAVNRRDRQARSLYVFFPAVVRGLGGKLFDGGPKPKPRDREALGRGLARVIAHELVHALCPRLAHRSGGLMTAKLSRRQLRQARFGIERDVGAVFKLRLREAIGRPAS